MSKILNAESLMTIYYAFFHSVGTYGILVWGSAYDNVLSGVQRAQNRLIKLIIKKKNTIKIPLKIKECFLLEAILANYNDLSSQFISSNKNTRNKLIMPRVNKTISLKSGKIVAIKIFNNLDAHLKTLTFMD